MDESIRTELASVAAAVISQGVDAQDNARGLRDLTSQIAQQPAVARLWELLEADPFYGSYRHPGVVRVVGMNHPPYSTLHLAAWAIARATKVGADQTFAELQHHATRAPYRVTATLALADLHVEHAAEMADGIRVIPFTPDDYRGPQPRRDANGAKIRYSDNDSTFHITAALQLDLDHPWSEIPQGKGLEIVVNQALLRQTFDRLRVAKQCLELMRPSFIDEVGQYLAQAQSVPCAPPPPHGPGWRAIDRGDSVTLTPTELTEARELHSAYLRLSADARARLRIPIRRLESSLVERARGRNPEADVDSAIDLGIAVESLLMTDHESDELAYKFALRGAHLLGGADEAKRVTYFDIFTNLYDIRSKAVHRAKLPERLRRKIPGEDVAGSLKKGYGIAAQAIREMILQGVPDLDVMVLGKRTKGS
jgi:hypothetical protein